MVAMGSTEARHMPGIAQISKENCHYFVVCMTIYDTLLHYIILGIENHELNFELQSHVSIYLLLHD